MKQLIYAIALVSTFSLSANAESRGGIRPSDLNSKQKYEPEILDLKGVVRSAGAHGSNCNVDLELVESEKGKTYSISEPGELANLHCSKEKDFLVSLKAEKTSKFLFWGGKLKVREFEILEELESQPHKEAPVSRRASSVDRGPRR